MTFLMDLLTPLPGTVVYHLLIILGILPAAGIVWTEWRQTRNDDIQPYVFGVFGVMGAHLLVLLLAPMLVDATHSIAIIAPPLFYACDWLALLLLAWAFGSAVWGTRIRRILVIGLALWLVVTVGAVWQWGAFALSTPVSTYSDSWQTPVWYVLMALTAFGASVVLWRENRTGENRGFLPVLAFVILGCGALLGLAASLIGAPYYSLEGAGRLLRLLGYPLFAIVLYNSALQDLHTYRNELKDLSQEALRQSQELLFLIEATRSIGEMLDLSGMLESVADSVAMALRADTVAIFLTDAQHLESLKLVALYQILGGRPRLPRMVNLKANPILGFALHKRQLIFTMDDDMAPLRALFDTIGVSGNGPLLVQPMMRQENVLGVLVACNDSSKNAFSQEQQHLATTIAVQIAGAVENSRLYQEVESKAQEMARMLKVREAELRREEAIRESMAEGILVLDASGQVILLNRAAESILNLQRTELVGRPAATMLELPLLKGELNLEEILNSPKPVQATMDVGENKIRVHAAPVMLENGVRLGVVAILQDVTREQLAEESKREFIASISHELRTPLTAIKGYAEVMLSGMAGALPPGVAQFLGIIRESTARMSTLTDNIISVAEIERGRLGLSYQQIHLPDLINEVVARYRERISERELQLKLDFPSKFPEIEVDPHRLRLVIDNLLNNAIRFTYPEGRLNIGCRAVEGTAGDPAFFSIWISDTGVGIPVNEQPRIWERFYRADNPLSLEAGGLGIGLTITRALVEAHGGRVWVDSTPDQGSTFTILLPTQRIQAIPKGLMVEVMP